MLDTLPATVAVLTATIRELRDALAAAHAHAEAQAERIAALGRDLGRVHAQYRMAADELVRLKAMLWDAGQKQEPFSEGTTV